MHCNAHLGGGHAPGGIPAHSLMVEACVMSYKSFLCLFAASMQNIDCSECSIHSVCAAVQPRCRGTPCDSQF